MPQIRRARTGTGQGDQALRREQPTVVHPIVRTHPFTGRKCLYVSKGECEGIEGMPKDEALALIDELADRTVEERFRHRTGPLKLLVLGGSLGAVVLNERVPAALSLLAPSQRPQVTHQSGDAHIAAWSGATHRSSPQRTCTSDHGTLET